MKREILSLFLSISPHLLMPGLFTPGFYIFSALADSARELFHKPRCTNGPSCDDQFAKIFKSTKVCINYNIKCLSIGLSIKVNNKLGLSLAKLSSSLANYARCTNCFQLDCFPCKHCQYSHILHLNLVTLDTRI